MTTRQRTSTRLAVLFAVLALVATACGQKPDVADVAAGGGGFDSSGQTGGGAFDGGGGGGGDLGTGSPDGATGGTGGGTGGAGGGGTGGTAGGGAGGTGGDPAAPGGGGGAAPGGGGGGDGPAPAGDRTGISETTIKIGIHAPVSGAAPFPQNSFRDGAPVYWEFLKGKGGVHGRNGEIVFEDDQFDPAVARRVCQKMVEQDKVFLLVGGGGADQITACAQYANSVGVPYLSAGVNEAVLDSIRAYFALSMTYSQQSPLLVQLAKNQLGGGSFAIAVADTPSFADAHASITREAQQGGLNIVYNKSIPKSVTPGEALSIAQELCTADGGQPAEIVYILASPTTFLNIATAAGGQNCVPQYIGPGITSGLNTVAQVGGNNIGAAKFLSPFPQLDVIDRLDPDFRQAFRDQGRGNPDDIALALWGLNKVLASMFNEAGPDMSRQSFVQTLESGAEFASGVFPPVRYSADNHFGGSQTHLLEANDGAFRTIAEFVSSF
ncbi:MAG TPA: ABC transporter substrate-binding protein [Acidimicrobiales bacterium]|nr:ABC transporter substrate-binding protein [Acidimicrobiales bacterium]